MHVLLTYEEWMRIDGYQVLDLNKVQQLLVLYIFSVETEQNMSLKLFAYCVLIVAPPDLSICFCFSFFFVSYLSIIICLHVLVDKKCMHWVRNTRHATWKGCNYFVLLWTPGKYGGWIKSTWQYVICYIYIVVTFLIFCNFSTRLEIKVFKDFKIKENPVFFL